MYTCAHIILHIRELDLRIIQFFFCLLSTSLQSRNVKRFSFSSSLKAEMMLSALDEDTKCNKLDILNQDASFCTIFVIL